MKLKKDKEKHIIETYDTWLHAYMNADVTAYNYYFHKDYHFIGSTNNEEFLDKQKTTNFFELTGEQLSGITDLRNEVKIVEEFNELIFITHLFDSWFLSEDQWNYYGRFRCSSIMKTTTEGYRFIYQHFSIPDPKTAEGETIGYDKINEENQELREAIQRRTFELEQKNRELEVETALERIRAQAVAMKTSIDLLDIVVSMRNEFIKLGHQAHYFWHMMWSPATYEKAMTSGDGSRIGFVMTLPRHIHGDIPLLAKWEKSKDPTIVYAMNVDEAIEYVDKMIDLGDFKNIDPQAPSHDDIRHIGGLTFVMARTTHGEIGYSLPGKVENPPQQDLDILVQFAGAFDLAHQRFLDLQKAEQQAREVEIELALEKVRSRSMAMHKSDELKHVIQIVYDQLVQLHVSVEHAGFIIDYKDNEDMHIWLADHNAVFPKIVLPYFDCAHWNSFIEAKKTGQNFFANQLGLEEKNKFYKDLFQFIPDLPEDTKKTYFGFDGLAISTVLLDSVGLYIENYSGTPFSDKENAILMRVGKVFQQAYTRFLDLKKAEAQAREAQIEAALERVRSRSMAMTKSEQLSDVILEIHHKFKELDISMESRIAIVVVFDSDGKDFNQYIASNDVGNIYISTPYFEHPILDDFYRAKESGVEFFSKSYTEDEKNSYFKTFFETSIHDEIEGVEEQAKWVFEQKYYTHSQAFQKSSSIGMADYSGIPLNDNEIDIIKRFSKVFDQAYTRFSDLKKAELQAREAQINLAVERVRAKALAMHKSDEIMEVVAKLKEEVMGLDIPNVVASTIFLEADNDNIRMWDLSSLERSEKGYLAITDITFQLKKKDPNLYIKRVWENPNDYFVEVQNSKDLDRIIEFMYENNQLEIAKEVEDYTRSTNLEKLYHASRRLNNGKLCIDLLEPPPDEMEIILNKIGAAFDLAYKRFEDLQKAEAQTREAQIEASLERLRSRTMAMHTTNELQDVIQTVHQELIKLEIGIHGGSFIAINHEIDKELQFWGSGGTAVTAQKFIMPYYDKPFYTDIFNGIKSGPGFFTEYFSAKEKKDFFTFLFQHRPWSQLDKKEKEEVLSTPNGYVRSCCVSEHTSMVIINHFGRVFTESENLILKRFARVFEQTYTRFLDLQKAEKQAREAKIETALERVRSRSMAMHNSSELSAVVDTLQKEFANLDFNLTFCIINLINEEDQSNTVWAANPETGKEPESYYMKFENYPFHDAMWDAWKSRKKRFVYILEGEEKKIYDQYLYNDTEFSRFPEQVKKANTDLERYTTGFTFFKHSGLQTVSETEISNEDLAILERFGRVFEQAYTRFLDLQKAEAQAREAKIENALEKVRSRTMAMQSSDELEEVAVLLYKELITLKVTNFVSCGYVEVNEETQRQLTWVTNPGGDSMALFYLPLTGDATFDERYHAWKTKQTVFHQTVAGKEREDHLEYAITTFQSKEAEEMVRSQFPDPTVFYCFNFSHGYLHLVGGSLLSKEEEALLVRFTNVFEQTYARFLDLKKAEAQAKEANIQLALERVRAKTMAMKTQSDLLGIVELFGQQLSDLDVRFNDVTFIEGAITKNRDWELWSHVPNADNFTHKIHIPYIHTPYFTKTAKAVEEYERTGNPIQTKFFSKEEKDEFLDHYWKYAPAVPEKIMDLVYSNPGSTIVDAFLEEVTVSIVRNDLEPFKDEELSIFERFAKEFKQTYIRFLDIKKAEEQAREAQIEAALERIRSRTMGMQSSEELPEVANLLFKEVQGLGIPAWSCGYNILAEDKKSATCCMSSEGTLQTPFQLRLWGEASFDQMADFIQSDQTMLVQELGGRALEEHYAYMKSFPDLKPTFDEIERLGLSLPTYQINHLCKFNQGFILFITYEKVPHAHDIFKRFTKVFDQTYTRFLDLKKAEAQARESQIEAALERVRSHSMGMQSTDDFGAVTTEMFNQLRNFGEDLFATGIVFCDKHDGHVEQWHSIPGGGMMSPMIVPIDLDYIHQYRFDQWKAGKELFSIEIPSDFIQQHFEDIFKLPSAQITLEDLKSRNAPMPEAPPWEIDYGASFEHGYVLISSLKPLENTDILIRFTKVFEQAYTRFLDLKRAEAQAREAQIEAALEKVRSRSLSMQQPNELNEVVQLIAEKLQELDVILDLGGVVICTYFPDSKDVLHWIATPDSESSGKFLLPYFDHIILKEAWASKNKEDQWFSKAYSIEEKNSFFKHAFKHSDYKHFPEEAKKDILNRKNHTLSFAWSKHSALLIPSYSGLMPSENEKDILIRFAKVFEHAYIRFMDLQEKEVQAKALFEEKKRLEETLSDLQTTQKQLIQSEKMASLGELTAGIAHEIQNPLNFVNNFSEVSKELLEEMEEEIKNGDFEEVKAIMKDVIQNLEKINHHGKRADGIVKGMLQHSRSGSDKKEATDINSLADEYLRLAYHGLRAKDKSFNAELVTDFDSSLKPQLVVPQDIGRVILNLLTNAFYIVHQKKQIANADYKPTVSVSTKQYKNNVEIKVSDNGNGIPDHIKDKIFQPFFTTKPTGEGTGLGLSLSYDIITKGHGGELTVETKEGEGTSFIIKLPTK